MFHSSTHTICFVQSTLMVWTHSLGGFFHDQSRKLNSRSTITKRLDVMVKWVAFLQARAALQRGAKQERAERSGGSCNRLQLDTNATRSCNCTSPSLHDVLGPALENPPHLPDFRQHCQVGDWSATPRLIAAYSRSYFQILKTD